MRQNRTQKLPKIPHTITKQYSVNRTAPFSLDRVDMFQHLSWDRFDYDLYIEFSSHKLLDNDDMKHKELSQWF